jgi:hypothetical protein
MRVNMSADLLGRHFAIANMEQSRAQAGPDGLEGGNIEGIISAAAVEH